MTLFAFVESRTTTVPAASSCEEGTHSAMSWYLAVNVSCGESSGDVAVADYVQFRGRIAGADADVAAVRVEREGIIQCIVCGVSTLQPCIDVAVGVNAHIENEVSGRLSLRYGSSYSFQSRKQPGPPSPPRHLTYRWVQ